MCHYEPMEHDTFDIDSAYVTIAARAALFRSKGRNQIWIYLINGELHFHPVKLNILSKFYIGHYNSRTLMHGLSNKAWDKLGRKIARSYFQNK